MKYIEFNNRRAVSVSVRNSARFVQTSQTGAHTSCASKLVGRYISLQCGFTHAKSEESGQ